MKLKPDQQPRIALLYPGDRAARDRSDPAEGRFAHLFQAFAQAGVHAEPAIYHDDFADEVRAQLSGLDAVLVWHNPIEGGRRRGRLDAMLAELSDAGVLISTHPDTIRRLGTKDVLYDTRDLPFGSDVHRVDLLDQLARDLPERLNHGPRVLKQHRGHSGIGVWRVEWAAVPGHRLLVRHAQRGSEEQLLEWDEVLRTMSPYFDAEAGGHMIDQAYQPALARGMLRAYLVEDRVTGFGHQAVNALYPNLPGQPLVQPGPRLYYEPDLPQFQPLRQRLESGWIELLRQRTGVARGRLPMLWDCDFMFGEPTAEEPHRFVLCEVNVSSVSPFPPSSVAPLVEAVKNKLSQGA